MRWQVVYSGRKAAKHVMILCILYFFKFIISNKWFSTKDILKLHAKDRLLVKT